MDVSVNQPFKAKMKEQWIEWFRSNNDLTQQGNRKQPTRQDVLTWVSRAWRDVSEEVIRHSFILCGITADVTGAEDEQMFSHVPRVMAGEVEEEEEEDEEENESPDICVEGDDFDPFSDL